MEKKEEDHSPSIAGTSATAKPVWKGGTKCCVAFALGDAATMAAVGCTVTGCCISTIRKINK